MQANAQKRIAVVLFNLGGPDSLLSVKPFLFNLFNDRAIIRSPRFIRYFLAKFITARRTPQAKKIYEKLGGRSPILENTQAQARALEKVLANKGEFKIFVCMRYWHPLSDRVAQAVKNYAPDHIILLPLYPQFSTATTESAFKDWHQAAQKTGITASTSAVCCYPTELRFLAAHLSLLKEAYWDASELGSPRVLFSAHGLPQKIIEGGDPYTWQVEQTVQAIVTTLAHDGLDYALCYQSRIGPLKWVGPSTLEEIQRAGKDGRPVVVVPISFVSEHAETLVELDIEYKKLALAAGVKKYVRVPALGTSPEFIECLAQLCLAHTHDKGIVSGTNNRCLAHLVQCPNRIN